MQTEDEQSVAIVSFRGAVKREIVKQLRKLRVIEDMNSFCIQITANGRTSSGDIKITFGVGDSAYGVDVTGNDLDEVIEELLRRKGWQKRHEPLMLTANEQQRADADRTYTNKPDDDNVEDSF